MLHSVPHSVLHSVSHKIIKKIMLRINKMKLLNYDVEGDEDSNFTQLYPFMPDRCFRMLICAPSGSGKTNLLLNIINKPLLFFDKIYLYAKNLQQNKYQYLLKKFEPLSKKYGYNIIEASNGEIIPLDDMDGGNQKLIIFDDYLHTTTKNDQEIRNYFIGSRNKNCSCIYLSQSFYKTDKTIRMNCSHYCIFELEGKNEERRVCQELNINKDDYLSATKEPYTFLYLDKPRKFKAKNFDEKI